MTSLFASQFGYTPTYGLNGLATSEPEVGVRLPKTPKTPKVPVREPAGANSGASSGLTAGAAAEAGASSGLTAGAGSGASASTGANALARQGTMSKLMHMENTFSGASNSASVTGGASAPVTRAVTGADATLPSPNWGQSQNVTPQTMINRTTTSPTTVDPSTITANSGSSAPRTPAVFGSGHMGSPGIWGDITGAAGQLGHDVSTAGHDMLNTFQQQNSFGQPGFEVPGAPGSSVGSATGAAAQHGSPLTASRGIRTSTDTGVTEPTNVWNPSSYTSEPGSLGSTQAPAISMSPNYANQFGSDFGRQATQDLPGAVTRQGLSQEISNFFDKVNPSQFGRSLVGDLSEEG